MNKKSIFYQTNLIQLKWVETTPVQFSIYPIHISLLVGHLANFINIFQTI